MQGRKKNEEEKSQALFRREYNPWLLNHTEWALPLCQKRFSLTNWGTIIVLQKNLWPLCCAKIRTHSNRIPKSSKTVFHSWLYGAHLKKPWQQRSFIHLNRPTFSDRRKKFEDMVVNNWMHVPIDRMVSKPKSEAVLIFDLESENW